MDRTPLIDKRASNGMDTMGYMVLRNDGNDGQSPICGPAALTSLIRKKERQTTAGCRSSPLYEPPRNCVSGGGSNAAALSMFVSRTSYEEITDNYCSHDDTESSSGSDKSGEAIKISDGSYPQFYPHKEEATSVLKGVGEVEHNNVIKDPQPRTLNRPRVSSWASTLAAVTEETSFDELSRDVSAEQLPCEKPTLNEQREQHMAPEKKEMLMAMRSLILKQQDALKEISEQNAQYRKKIGDYQSKLIEMKQEALNQQARIDQLALEKEASLAECLYLREEMQALQHESKYDVAAAEARTDEHSVDQETEHRDDAENTVKEYDDEDDEDSLQDRFKEMMKPSDDSPAYATKLRHESPVCSISIDHERKPLGNNFRSISSPIAHGREDTSFDQSEAMSHVKHVTDENVWRPICATSTEATNATGQQELTESPSKPIAVHATEDTCKQHFGKSSGFQSQSRTYVKQELALYKKRLESIQKKRNERRAGIKQYNKPVVRFGAP